ncbi:MAG: hypothetical protein U5K29_08070 [Acidimicrobiales bacterium]|nr:hypothetical protein [Acidimicrobiales bacterium]
MATTEHARHQLYQRLNETIGIDEADTLMELLPPVGWADVATKADLAHLADRMDARFEEIDQRFDQIDQRFGQTADNFDLKLDTCQANLRTEIADLRIELHRSLRTNMIVTVGVLGTLTTTVGLLTSIT